MWESYKKIKDNFLQYLYHLDINCEEFSGSVLYVGLGTCYLPRHQSTKVTKTTIIEISDDVIEWCEEKNYLNEDWIIHNLDAKEFDTDEKFDIIVLDMWLTRTSQTEFDLMYKKYANYLTKKGKIYWLKSIVDTTIK